MIRSEASARTPGFIVSRAWWLACALALRVGFALRLGDGFYQVDENGFCAQARALALSGSLGPHGVAPLTPGFFALVFRAFGDRFLYARLAQAVLGAATAWIIGLMTEDLARSRRAGTFALAVSAVYPFFIYYSGMLMSETLDVFFVVLSLWALVESLGTDSPAVGAAAGLLSGLAALVRPENAPIFLLLWLAAGAWRLSRRRAVRPWILAVLLWAQPILFWCARNELEVGAFKLDDHGGMTLVHGTILFDLNEIDTGVAMDSFRRSDLYGRAQSLSEPAQDALYMRAAADYMRSHPKRTARQWARKFVNFWRFYPRVDKRYADLPTNHPSVGLPRGALVAVSLLFEPWLILAGLWGLWRLWRQRPETLVLPLFVLSSAALHAVSVSQMRYRLPVMPLLILGAAVLWDARQGADALRRRPRQSGFGAKSRCL